MYIDSAFSPAATGAGGAVSPSSTRKRRRRPSATLERERAREKGPRSGGAPRRSESEQDRCAREATCQHAEHGNRERDDRVGAGRDVVHAGPLSACRRPPLTARFEAQQQKDTSPAARPVCACTVDRGRARGKSSLFEASRFRAAPSPCLRSAAACTDYLFCRETMAKVAVADLLVDAKLCRVVEEELAPAAHVDPAAFWSATSALIHEYAPRNQVRARPRHRSPPPFPA